METPDTIPVLELRNYHCILHPRTYSDEDFEALVSERRSPVWMLLRSGGEPSTARYSIAGMHPLAIIEGKQRTICITTERDRRVGSGMRLLDFLDGFMQQIRHSVPDDVLPCTGGLLGYISYDIRNEIERLPDTAIDDQGLADVFFFFPGLMCIHDRETGQVHELRFEGDVRFSEHRKEQDIPAWSYAAQRPEPTSVWGFDESSYMEAVERIRTYIRNGDIYQVNLAQRFVFPAPENPYGFWKRLFEMNPAPYYAYLETPTYQVLSTSMEMCLTVHNGIMWSQPIKGTRPRGRTVEEDEALKHELRTDPKERAELSMIVDLVRNDISRVCEPGSVTVRNHLWLDSYANVHHLSSIVEGAVCTGAPLSEVLRAVLPAGSITGCPKIRAMEIIDELEPVARHIYTGSIGYLGLHGSLALNVAIRTAVCTGKQIFFSTGSGIVYDSIPKNEYLETLHKGETFFQAIQNQD